MKSWEKRDKRTRHPIPTIKGVAFQHAPTATALTREETKRTFFSSMI